MLVAGICIRLQKNKVIWCIDTWGDLWWELAHAIWENEIYDDIPSKNMKTQEKWCCNSPAQGPKNQKLGVQGQENGCPSFWQSENCPSSAFLFYLGPQWIWWHSVPTTTIWECFSLLSLLIQMLITYEDSMARHTQK